MLVGFGDGIGDGFDLVRRVAHGDAQARGAEHTLVIAAVAQGQGLGRVDAQQTA